MDRVRNKIVSVSVSNRRDKSVYLGMARNLESGGFKVNILCTDGYEGYAYYHLAKRHVVSKTETSLVESKNSLIRLYLARFHRKTRRYSKVIDMISASLLVLFYKAKLLKLLSAPIFT